jgi:hypothetical protein
MEKFQMKAKSFKKMEDPVRGKEGNTKFVCFVQANTMQQGLLNWMGINPREQKMTTNVARKIIESLKENRDFHDLNKGILFSAIKVKYDNRTEVVSFEMEDPELHGNIDGGHTLRAILELSNEELLAEDRFVFVEFFDNIKSSVDIANARNTAVQVDLKSIEELKKSFETLKQVMSGLSFENRIAYKMNEHYEENINTIDVREIIAILNMFNQTLYPKRSAKGSLSPTQPIQSYSGKEVSLKKFINLGKDRREKLLVDMQPIVDDIFKLWDLIETDFVIKAKQARKKYGSRKYAKYSNGNIVGKSFLNEKELKYIIPKGLMYPIVGAFRALIEIDPSNKQYKWVKDPFKVWDSIGSSLVSTVLDEKIENPDVIAKNPNLWSNLFKEVLIFGYM